MRAGASAASDATVRGVKLGAITGAFGFAPAAPGTDKVDDILAKAKASGAGHIELVNSVLEPAMGGPCQMHPPPGGFKAPPTGQRFNPPCGIGGQVPSTYPQVPDGYTEEREKLRQWRLNADLNLFHETAKKFKAAGVDLYSYVMTIGEDFTEPEIEAVFQQMQALGVDKFCTNQTRVSAGPRMVRFAEKYKIKPAFHTHDLSQDPNEVASPESLAKLLAMSPWFYVNLDIGWYFRGGNDPFAYIKEHHERITHLHIRDANADKSQADIGTGVIHVADILHYIRDNKLDIGCIVEQNGRSGAKKDLEGLKMNIDWMRQQLLA
jgi:sugar phosphate isomerase/epimerase